MAKTANELLQGILSTVVKIESKLGATSKGSSSEKEGPKSKDTINIFKNLADFGKVKEETKRSFVSFMKDISEIGKGAKNFDYFSDGITKISIALPNLIKNLNDLSKMTTDRLDKSMNSLRRLYDFMHEVGDGRKAGRVERGISLLDKIGTSLQKISKPLKEMSSFLTYFAIGIASFAISLLLTSKLLSLSKPIDVVYFLGFTIASLIVMFGVLALSEKIVTKGHNVVKDIGFGLATLALGILGFGITLRLLPVILGKDAGTIGEGFLLMGTITVALVGMFALFGFAENYVNKGSNVIDKMGVSLLILGGAIIGFALILKLLPVLLNGDA